MQTTDRVRTVLGRAAVPAFLEGADGALKALGDALDPLLGLGRARRPVERLRGSLECIRYLHGWPERFTLEAAFTVNPTEPGFPGLRDVWLAEQDRAHAAEKLALLPSVDRIVESAVRDVRAGRYPLVWQRALVQRRYYERLLRGSLVAGFEVGTPRHALPASGRPHQLDWSGIAEEDTCFVIGLLDFSTDAGQEPPAAADTDGELHRTLRFGFGDSIGRLFDHLETLHDVNPQVLTRLEIGPFHAHGAASPAAAKLLDAPGSWLLETTCERLERERGTEGTDAPELTRLVVCPSNLVQRLANSDPEGRPARVVSVEPNR